MLMSMFMFVFVFVFDSDIWDSENKLNICFLLDLNKNLQSYSQFVVSNQ
jgi:hypothetical protein